MIYDRTLTDVNSAALLRKKMQAGQTLTAAEQAAFERGACTVSMLNRIESKQAELMGILNAYYYMVTIETKQWDKGKIFGADGLEMQRLFSNLDALKQAFCVYQSTPGTPSYLYGYQEANDTEKILADIENMIGDMEGRFRECGTFQCGEANTL